MRVLLVVPQYPPAIGGVELHAQMLANHLAERGVAVEVACTDPGSPRPYEETVDGVPVRRFPTLRGDATFFLSPDLARWLDGHAADHDLVHAHSYHTPLPLLAALAGARQRVPLVVTPHFHGTGHTAPRRLLHVPYRVTAAWMLRRAAAIICVSGAERDLLRARFRVPAAKVHVIHNGIEPDEFLAPSAPATAADAAPAREAGLDVLVVGRLERYKNAPRVARAVSRLADDARLVVVGDGADRQALLAAAEEAGLGERLRWFARLPRDELIARYREANVFVSMSEQEAFGITLLEAAVAGARVVASDIAPHREVAGLLPDGSVSLVERTADDGALAGAIREAASRGRVTGAELTVPTWRGAAEQTHRLYEQVLAR